MGSADHKKTKRRKSKKATKPSTATKGEPVEVETPEPPPATAEFVQHQELGDIQQLMNAEDDHEPPPAPFSKGPNPYLGGDRCLLCHCERPEDTKLAEEKLEAEDGAISGVGSLAQLPLWVCQECRKTVEEEEKKTSVANMLDQDLRVDPASLSLITEFTPGSEPTTPNGSVCTCEACTERRWVEATSLHDQIGQIEVESEKENQQLQKCWVELRHVVRYVYREMGTGLSTDDDESQGLPDITKIQELVHRWVARDPHQLFQRLESQAEEYVIEVKVRLLKQMSTGLKTPQQARQFVAMLLEEYQNLCAAAKKLASYISELNEHLKQFKLTWELHNKHLFHSTIYSDPMLLNKLPLLMAHLRYGSKEDGEDSYTSVLHGYCKFDDEMSVVSVVWRDCFQLIENYTDEQAAMKAKQKMLKEDWEFFKAQRKLLEQQVLKSKSTNTSTQSLETQFTETMRHILQGTKPSAEECLCPNCNRKRCPCDECSISHMITCGIINPEVSDQMPGHNPLLFTHDPSRYIIDVTPPSMSSTSSSSGSESPIMVEPEKLALPFDENFELADEIPEEIEVQYGDSDEDSAMEEAHKQERGAGDGAADGSDEVQSARMAEAEYDEDEDNEDEDDDEDDEDDLDEDDEEDDDDEDDDNEDDEDDDEEDEEDDDEDEEEDDEEDSHEMTLSSVTTAALQFAGFGNPVDGGQADSCDCNHCTLQAKFEQVKNMESDNQNQCQCHACLQQSGKTLTTSLPQHLPSAPRPAALHLYPHIHGSNNLHAGLHGHAAAPILRPQLYQLHNPLNLPAKSLSSAQLHLSQQQAQQQLLLQQQQDKTHSPTPGFNLDMESHEALSEHIYHTYQEWDNSATKLMLSPQKFDGSLSSELFNAPTPPLLSGSPFVADLSSVAASMDNSLAGVVKTSTILQQFPSTSKPSTTTVTTSTGVATSLVGPPAEHTNCVISGSSDSYLKNLKPISHSLFTQALNAQAHALGSPAHVVSSCTTTSHLQCTSQVPTQTKPAMFVPSSSFGSLATTMVGSMGLASVPSVPATNSVMALGTATTDFCQKHNSFLHGQPFAAAAALGSSPLGVSNQVQQPILSPHTPSMCPRVKEEAMNLHMLNLPHTCNLSGSLPLTAAGNTFVQLPQQNKIQPIMPLPTMLPGSTSGSAAASPPLSSARKAGLDPCGAASVLTPAQLAASANGNVSVGTSTLCQDGECEGHVPDDNYDSIDDSCSEQSSSTSTSNQKDGKYCDCCYCEFFGHTTTLPTSRNFTEMREKLRLKLKKKNEAKTVDVPQEPEPVEPPVETPPDPLEQKGLDELLRFINGSNEAKEPSRAELKQSSKAAKRARQKQRKAEEKARKEVEEEALMELERISRHTHAMGMKLSHHNHMPMHHVNNHNQPVCSASSSSGSSPDACALQQKKKKTKHKEDTAVKASDCKHGTKEGRPTSSNSQPKSRPSSARHEAVHSYPHHDVVHQHPPTSRPGPDSRSKSQTSAATSQNQAPNKTQKSVQGKPEDNVAKRKTEGMRKPSANKGAHDDGSSGSDHRIKQDTTKVVTSENAKLDKRKKSKLGGSPPVSSVHTMQQAGHHAAPHQTQQPTSNKPKQQHLQALLDNLKKQPNHSSVPQEALNTLKNNQNLQHQQLPKGQKHQHNASLTKASGLPNLTNNHFNLSPKKDDSPHPKLVLPPTSQSNNANNQTTAGGKSHNQNNSLSNHVQPQQQQQANKKKNKKPPQPQQAVAPQQQNGLGSHHQPQPPPQQPQQQQQQQQQQKQSQASRSSSQPSTPVKRPGNPSHQPTPKDNMSNQPNKSKLRDRQVNDQLTNGTGTPSKISREHEKKHDRGSPNGERAKAERSSKQPEQGSGNSSGKSKKNKRKNKTVEDLDEIFMPKDETDHGDLDEYEREIEEFKRFCMDSTTVAKREKLQVQVNLKDIFSKKKSGLGCA